MYQSTSAHLTDPLLSIVSDNIPVGTPVLVTAIHHPQFLSRTTFDGIYGGELDVPVEALHPEVIELFISTGIARAGGDRVRTAKIFVPSLNRNLTGFECEWKVC